MLALKDQGKVKTSRTSRIKGRNTNWILIRRSYEILPLWTALCTFGFLYVYRQVSAVVHGLLFFFFRRFLDGGGAPLCVSCHHHNLAAIPLTCALCVSAVSPFLQFSNSPILPFFSVISFNWTKLPTCVPICILIRFPSTRADSTRCPLTFPRAFEWKKRERGGKSGGNFLAFHSSLSFGLSELQKGFVSPAGFKCIFELCSAALVFFFLLGFPKCDSFFNVFSLSK